MLKYASTDVEMELISLKYVVYHILMDTKLPSARLQNSSKALSRQVCIYCVKEYRFVWWNQSSQAKIR